MSNVSSNFRSISGLVNFANSTGSHFFDKSTMEFFYSRLHTLHKVNASYGYLVTSEQFGDDFPREFNVREYRIDGYSIDFDTVATFDTFYEAQVEVDRLRAMFGGK